MRAIFRDFMRISIHPHYVCVYVTLRTIELMQVKEKPCIDMLLYICVYAHLCLCTFVFMQDGKYMFSMAFVAAVPSVVDHPTYEQICNIYTHTHCKFY